MMDPYQGEKVSSDSSKRQPSKSMTPNLSKLQWALLGPISLTLLTASYLLTYSNTIRSTYTELLDSSPVVILPQGRISGTSLDDDYPNPIEGFLGVPYAFPPTGDRRFRHLSPLPASSETTNAKAFGKICPGKSFRFAGPKPLPMGEDCLTANIFRPWGVKQGAKLPVALHFHGGAFNRGHSFMQDTASMLAWSENPFVGVNFNYRLVKSHAFAFFSSVFLIFDLPELEHWDFFLQM